MPSSVARLPVQFAFMAGFAGALLPLPSASAEPPSMEALAPALCSSGPADLEDELDRVRLASLTSPDGLIRQALAVSRGDTLMKMLAGANVPVNEASEAISALREVYDPRTLQIGQEVTVLFEPRRGEARRFMGLEIAPDVVRSVAVARADDETFAPSSMEKAVERQPAVAQGEIRSSLFEAGGAAGVPVSVMMALIRAFSHDVDFQRDLQPGDRFAVLWERMVTEDGVTAGEGDLLFAMLELGGKQRPIFRFETRNGRVDHYNRQGESIRRALLTTPIDGARISSGFGMRRHPILGYSKMHKGVDFAAPTGTPIYAAGRGTVEELGDKGAYGNYVRIRHNNEISTAYAHLSRFAGHVRRGARVDQGDVIGYVGSTGRSTGPHLHYEVMRHGRQVNPRSIDLPIGEKLEARELQAFQAEVRRIERMLQDAQAGLQLASAPRIAFPPLPPRKVCGPDAGC